MASVGAYTGEPRVLRAAPRYYRLAAPPSHERNSELGEEWRPFRAWATVLLRYAAEKDGEA